MPIDTRCPSCQKAYRLKDEFLGKKVKCPNPECQKPFTVAPLPTEAAPKPKPSPAPKKSAAEQEREAEALFAALLNEEQSGPAEEVRNIDYKCTSCDHVWPVGVDKRGKFVVCPECGFRQKVADKKQEKKIDWRDPNANRPSLARGEEVPEDLRQQQMRDVSNRALEEVGVIKEEIEPVPLAVKLQRIGLVLGVLAAIGFGVLYFLQSRQEGKEQRFMEEALAEVEKISEDGLPKGQLPLLKSVLFGAGAEHAIRNDTSEQRKLAQERITAARQAVEQSPRSLERDLVLAELAPAVARFGGTEEQVGKEIRLRWQPAGQMRTAQLTAGVGDVQTELRRIFEGLLKANADLDLRLVALRRTVKELNKAEKTEILPEILGQGFAPAELPDAFAHAGLVLHRAGNATAANSFAGQGKSIAFANPQQPLPSASLQVLCELTGVALKPEEKFFTAPASGTLSSANRLYATLLNAVNKDANTAIAFATRESNQPDDKLRALAIVADWIETPGEAVSKGEAILTSEGRGRTNATFALLRLSAAAGRAGSMDLVEKLAVALPDDGLKVWAKAEAIRGKLEANPTSKVETSLIEPTTDKAKLRVGHIWTAAIVARHNAMASGDQTASKEYSGWSESAFKAAGLAGLALGVQDRKK